MLALITVLFRECICNQLGPPKIIEHPIHYYSNNKRQQIIQEWVPNSYYPSGTPIKESYLAGVLVHCFNNTLLWAANETTVHVSFKHRQSKNKSQDRIKKQKENTSNQQANNKQPKNKLDVRTTQARNNQQTSNTQAKTKQKKQKANTKDVKATTNQ